MDAAEEGESEAGTGREEAGRIAEGFLVKEHPADLAQITEQTKGKPN